MDCCAAPPVDPLAVAQVRIRSLYERDRVRRIVCFGQGPRGVAGLRGMLTEDVR